MKLMGHRGAKGEYPENTLGGFEFAIENGVASIEFDIHLTKDEEVVVIHDDTLERTTNGTGEVRNFTLSELQKLNAGKGERIPTLNEALSLISKAEGVSCQIELKSSGLEEKVVSAIHKHQMINQASAISFNHRYLKAIKDLDPAIQTFPLIYGLPENALSIISPINAQGISISIATVDQQLVEQCHREGLLVTVWNVNNEEDFQKFSQLGVDYAGTDYPSKFRK